MSRDGSRFVGMVVALVGLNACATQEWIAVNTQCQLVFLDRIPPQFIERHVERYRTERVPDGSYSCRSVHNGAGLKRTDCLPGTREILVPYVVSELFDINDERRDLEIRHCTMTRCTQAYGNPSCEIPKPAGLT